MAVLVRSTAAVLGTLRRALVGAGVPVAVRGDDLPLAEQPAVAMLLEILRCLLDPSTLTEDLAERMLTGPIARGDVVTTERHRAVIAERTPELLRVWTELTEVTRAVAGRRSWTS